MDSLVCASCKKAGPVVFLIVEGLKVPFCREHCLTYILEHSVFACGPFPIAAFDFMERSSDYPSYEEQTKVIDNAIHFLDYISKGENEQFTNAIVHVNQMEDSTHVVVEQEFKVIRQRLKSWNENFITFTQDVRTELENAKAKKGVELSAVASLLEHTKNVEKMPEFLSSGVQPIESKIRKAVASCISNLSYDFEAIIRSALTSGPVRIKSDPVDIEELTRKCSVCPNILTQYNFLDLAGHEDCGVCLKCIEEKNKVKLLCPKCKRGYPKAMKEVLKSRIPEFFIKFKKIKKQKRDRRYQGLCFHCKDKVEEVFHSCSGGRKICLFCCQIRIIRDELGKPAICPECGQLFSEEIFKEFVSDNQACSECPRELLLEDVRHCCLGIKKIPDRRKEAPMLCKDCTKKFTTEGNRCGKCQGNLQHQKVWGESDTEEERQSVS